ncbi:alanine racemase [Methylomicrobium sp. Wu6]|uniref:alanine racemase n=1 Tax=Methylomicrobium sp. Wu6 TaxID=3107928 RepID=UPI002DD69B49|nr:alanine racemase [Methylomicrobium sp. Wu6]MEC4750453.1 alanine racemase [Methylomicrobium sp. Wu6]
MRQGRVHDTIVMVDLGDLREGVWPDHVIDLAKAMMPLAGIKLKGIGTNLACFGGTVPTRNNMRYLSELAGEIERACALSLEWVAGLNSSGLILLSEGRLPARINYARIGEGILLGRETTRRNAWPGTYQDAFVLQAEVVELKKKPSAFNGERGEDAFGGHPNFENHGDILHALVNIGRQDVNVEGITPVEPAALVGASSSATSCPSISITQHCWRR